jgi:hypothetical protein
VHIDEVREVLICAEVRIDVREVEPPVAVARRGEDLVDDGRGDPDRVEAEALDPRKPALDRYRYPSVLEVAPCEAVEVGSNPVAPSAAQTRGVVRGSPFAYRSVITMSALARERRSAPGCARAARVAPVGGPAAGPTR